MYAHPEAGRFDHIHGDEDYREHQQESVDLIDVIWAIEGSTHDPDGLSYHKWIDRICDGDEITTIIQHIVKNRQKPEFAELINEIEIAIEGYL